MRSKFLLGALPLATLLLTLAPARADDPPHEQARRFFTAGVNLLKDPSRPRYDEAYVEFKRAYALVPSYKILGNIALCAMKLERDSEAIEAYTRYLGEAVDLTPEEREQAERDLVTLKAGLANVIVETKPAGAILHDTRAVSQGDPITNVYGPMNRPTQIGLRRGHHIIKARFADGGESLWEADIAGDESHVFVAPVNTSASPDAAAGRPTRPVPAMVYAAGGATLLLGAGSAVTGFLALDKHSQYESKNDGADPSGAENLRSSGRTLNLVSDVLLVSAVVGFGATLYLYLTRPQVSPAASAGVFVGPGSVFGRF